MVLISELRRRNVFRVALAYAVIAWLTLQVGDTLAPALRLGDRGHKLLAFFLIRGFPMTLLLGVVIIWVSLGNWLPQFDRLAIEFFEILRAQAGLR